MAVRGRFLGIGVLPPNAAVFKLRVYRLLSSAPTPRETGLLTTMARFPGGWNKEANAPYPLEH